jgi:hypothetical protein
MKKYIRCHFVEATPMTRGAYNKKRGWTLPKDENPKDKGYLVKYPDGYVSWCPKAQFEAAGRPVDGMTFGMAIEAMKAGKKVARAGWNGKGMFLWLKPATTIKAEWCKDEMLKGLVEANGGEILGLGTICMYTHDSTGRKAILTGWLASQSDMLFDDWQIVE